MHIMAFTCTHTHQACTHTHTLSWKFVFVVVVVFLRLNLNINFGHWINKTVSIVSDLAHGFLSIQDSELSCSFRGQTLKFRFIILYSLRVGRRSSVLSPQLPYCRYSLPPPLLWRVPLQKKHEMEISLKVLREPKMSSDYTEVN